MRLVVKVFVFSKLRSRAPRVLASRFPECLVFLVGCDEPYPIAALPVPENAVDLFFRKTLCPQVQIYL